MIPTTAHRNTITDVATKNPPIVTYLPIRDWFERGGRTPDESQGAKTRLLMNAFTAFTSVPFVNSSSQMPKPEPHTFSSASRSRAG